MNIFDSLDKDCQGFVRLNDIKNSFTPKYHPDVKS